MDGGAPLRETGRRTISAAVARGRDLPFGIEQVSLEMPRSDEVLVRIEAVGVCHTDLAFKSAALIPFPAVLGHEGAGVVLSTGEDVRHVHQGDRVLLTFSSCGVCNNCEEGHPGYCADFARLNFSGLRPDGSSPLAWTDGAITGRFFGQSSFATHAIADARTVVPIPDWLSFERAAPFGCGIQTGAGAIMRSLACRAGEALLVIGGGTVGLAAVMAATIRGCNPVVVIEPMEPRRMLARDLGATHVLDPVHAHDLTDALRAIAPDGFDCAFDTAGRLELLTAAAAVLAPRGQLGIVGIAPAGSRIPVEINTLVGRGLRVTGIIEGDSDGAAFLYELFQYHADGLLPVERLIRAWPLDRINEAVAAQHRGEFVKAVLLCGGPSADAGDETTADADAGASAETPGGPEPNPTQPTVERTRNA